MGERYRSSNRPSTSRRLDIVRGPNLSFRLDFILIYRVNNHVSSFNIVLCRLCWFTLSFSRSMQESSKAAMVLGVMSFHMTWSKLEY
jgi:hypothetical protein